MPDGVRLQDLREITVQIRHAAQPEKTVGTGVAVSMAGGVVTCAHVVALAGGDPTLAGSEVGVYFPQARGDDVRARRARVACCFDGYDDDVVLLELVGGPSPLAPEQIAVLGPAEGSEEHPFRSYGYRRLAEYQAGLAHGTIQGSVEGPRGRRLLLDPWQIESSQINAGMSGAAVLDMERNLVVGLVSEAYFPPAYTDPLLAGPQDRTLRDRDTGWAVNARVLALPPALLALRDAPWPLRSAPEPKTDLAAARAAAGPAPAPCWNNAPPPLPEWVGRAARLAALDADWADAGRRVTGLIGFGGEGKSSLARRWVDRLLAGETPGPPPDGVFWWGFYERPSVDEFFEAALKWLSGDRIDLGSILSSGARAAFLGGMLSAGGRCLFVLDGLEVMQEPAGDRYGLLKSADLRDFLGYLATPNHRSFALLTSRAPVLDLIAYPGYVHRDVERLLPADGRALLRALGVRGPDAALDRLVADWDGHALTLGLLGGLLAERYGGDLARLADLPPPLAGEPRYERVHRVLRRYDEHLDAAERAFLTLFSAFRTPVDERAFETVFRARAEEGAATRRRPKGLAATIKGLFGSGAREGPATPPLNAPIAELDDAAFRALVARLVQYRLLRFEPAGGLYTAHPLVRAHYLARLTAGGRGQAEAAHARIKDYYLAIAGDMPTYPTLDDLLPLIEVVHHACRAGAYDEAHRIRWERVDRRERGVVIHQLGAYETELALNLEFFPGGDAAREPGVSDPRDKSWILNSVGLCLMNLGRLGQAAPFYERSQAIDLGREDWQNAGIGYQNLAELHAHRGALAESAAAAGEALALARRAANKGEECDSLAWQAWVAHLRGDGAAAGAAFRQAEALEREITPGVRFLYGLRGLWHAERLRRAGDAEQARRITEANLRICEEYHWANSISGCHRVLGDLDAAAGRPAAARGHHDAACKIARGISRRDVLIEALLARGRAAAREADASAALADLEEALGHALEGGYRIYEADLRVALAWAHLAAAGRTPPQAIADAQGRDEEPAAAVQRARAEAERARQMSDDMGYYWGRLDAEEALRAAG